MLTAFFWRRYSSMPSLALVRSPDLQVGAVGDVVEEREA